MAFWILTNTAGAIASSMSIDGSTTESGYDKHDLISGPRSRMWRCEPYGSVCRVYCNLPEPVEMTHCVVARADLMMTEGGTQIDVAYGSGSGTNLDGIGPPINPSELVGIKVDGKAHGQDAVFEFDSPVTSNVFQVAIGHNSGTQAGMLAKVFFSAGLSLGDGPQPGPTWSVRRDGEPQIVKPLLGYEEYAVTDAIALRWANLSRQDIEDFEALPFNWACFLLDTDGDIFSHKLEHTLLTQYSWSRVGAESFTLDTVFQRLCHYP